MAKFPQVGDEFGAYRITGQIGQGGMGVVYSAEQSGLGRTVALKVLSPQYAAQADYQERFVREATVLARLDSVHIIHIYDHGERDGCLYIATQYVTGGDLGQAIKQAEGGLPVREAAEVVAQTAAALYDAHRAGVIHRDVKPSNVLLRDRSSELHAYLCDFGIAQGGQPGLTVAGSVAGTMGYMAPERCRGEAATPASDVYALGCVLWASLAGAPPYSGTDVEVGLQHLSEPVPQFRETDPTSRIVNAVLRRSMAKNPAERYPDAAAVRRDLRAIVDRTRSQPDLRLVKATPGAAGRPGGLSSPSGTGGSRPDLSRPSGAAVGPRPRPQPPVGPPPPPRRAPQGPPPRGSSPSHPSSPQHRTLPPPPAAAGRRDLPQQPGGRPGEPPRRGSSASHPTHPVRPAPPGRPSPSGRPPARGGAPAPPPSRGLQGQALAALVVGGLVLVALVVVLVVALTR
ncbi:serine/threonine-protein kinase [Nocardioides alkalitolerans]|uniref:serine/threonine-protein kinase n=1 Tax=Nocardioides alkalitolerans TaxID=281714 RepID=UPI00040704A7|nr:serine/threonine-protein kinase [Nocardioides alkalitolerans]